MGFKYNQDEFNCGRYEPILWNSECDITGIWIPDPEPAVDPAHPFNQGSYNCGRYEPAGWNSDCDLIPNWRATL